MKKKLFAFISIMLLFALCSCGGAATTTANQTTSAPADTSAPVETVDPTTVLDIPTEYDYDGYEVNILVSGNYNNNDFGGSADSRDVVELAQFKRNLEVESSYKVKIVVDNKIKFNSQKNGSGTGFDAFSTMYSSQSYDYDFATIGSYNAGSCAYSGLLADLNSLPNVDLSKQWWSQKANEQFNIRGKMYFTTGDISLAENRVVHLIVFNKEMLISEQLESPYDLVRQGKWTWDVLQTQVKSVSEDLDGDDRMTEKDKYGMMTWSDAYSAAVASVGSQIATVNSAGDLELTLMNDKSRAIVEKYADIIFDTNTCFDYQYGYAQSTWDTNRWGMFSGGQVLYYLASAAIPAQMREYDVQFGIIPYPKLTEDQDNYYSLTAAYHNQYVAVPYFIENPERTGMLLEILSYKGKQYVTPAFYDMQLLGRDTRDNESEEMLDIIYQNVVYDPGLVYMINGMANTYNQVRTQRTNVFVSKYESSKDLAQKDIDAINFMFSTQQ